MTVSRALTGNVEISKSTRERVLRTARAMGYQPNRWARSLVTRQSSIIGVVIPDIAHSYFADITFGIEEAIDGYDYDILLCHSRGDAEREKSEIAMLVGSRVDGLIVASVQPYKGFEDFERLRSMNIPLVLVDRFFSGAQFSCVRVDDVAVGRLAARHLLALGRRRMAHIAGPALSPALLRKRGFTDELRSSGIEIGREFMPRGDFEIESGRAAMKKLLLLSERPDAVFAANDPMAIGAVYACREAGLEVPRDVSIVGAGNIEGPHHPNPFLTTIDWPRVELGRRAAELLISAIRGERPEPAEIVLNPELLVRQSTAARQAIVPPAALSV